MAFSRINTLIIWSLLILHTTGQNDDIEDENDDNGRLHICRDGGETQIGTMCTCCEPCRRYECFESTAECLQEIARDSDCFTCLLDPDIVQYIETQRKGTDNSRPPRRHGNHEPQERIYLICGIFLSFVFGCIFMYIVTRRKCNSRGESRRVRNNATSWNRDNEIVMFQRQTCIHSPYDNTGFTSTETVNDQRSTTMVYTENNIPINDISDHSTSRLRDQDQNDTVVQAVCSTTVHRIRTDTCTSPLQANEIFGPQNVQAEGKVSQNSQQQVERNPTISNTTEAQTTHFVTNEESARRKDIKKSLSDRSNSDSSGTNSDRSSILKTYDDEESDRRKDMKNLQSDRSNSDSSGTNSDRSSILKTYDDEESARRKDIKNSLSDRSNSDSSGRNSDRSSILKTYDVSKDVS